MTDEICEILLWTSTLIVMSAVTCWYGIYVWYPTQNKL